MLKKAQDLNKVGGTMQPKQASTQAMRQKHRSGGAPFHAGTRAPVVHRRLHASARNSYTDITAVVGHSAASRRELLGGALALPLAAAAALAHPPLAVADDFTRTPSGLSYLDVREGTGPSPERGDTCVVHWSGYTKGYQGKRIDNTSVRDEPYEFVLGGKEAIQAFQEAVSTMRVGGIRRVEVPGDKPTLAYPRDRSARFTNELLPDSKGKIYKYRYGPQPAELGGQRALDFVLDNPTLQDFNRTLLYDIKLLSVRKARS